MLGRLYAKWGMDDDTDFQALSPTDYPILSDLYDVIEEAYRNYDSEEYPLYPRELLQELLLGLHSMCRGAESKFFNGHTNITSSRFLVFGVKGLLQASRNVKNALLFNVLSYLSDKLLTEGNTAAGLDELYIWLSNLTAIEYIRNCLKRVRNERVLHDPGQPESGGLRRGRVRELTRPLFAIPTERALKLEENALPNFHTVRGLGRDFALRDLIRADKNQLAIPEVFPDESRPCSC